MAEEQTRNRVLALAGTFQGAFLASCVATRGRAEARYFNASIGSLLSHTDEGVERIYGGVLNLKPGLEHLSSYLVSSVKQQDLRHIAVYAHKLIRLADILMGDQQKIAAVAEAIATLRGKRRRAASSALISEIAALYYHNFSSLPPQHRIRVIGKKEYLTPKANVERIRAALFAGIRAAALWRQSGGGLLALWLGKKKLLNVVTAIRAESGLNSA